MNGRILGISAGSPRGNAEIVLREALAAAAADGAHVELLRLDALDLPNSADPGQSGDAWWLWDQLLDADGLIISAPILSRVIPARLKLLVDVLLGPNADAAIVARILAMRAAGEEPVFAFRADERVLRPRVAGFIAVGGSLTPQWKSLALPTMHLLTFSMQTAVVDQFVISGAGTPKSVVLDEDALKRAAELGRNVAAELGRTFEEAEYHGDPGACPLCHLDIVELRGRSVQCATCGARGELRDDFTVHWTDLRTSVISVPEKDAHFEEILDTARRHAELRATVQQRAAAYATDDLVIHPPTHEKG
jgi:multimeric flavodoxin WrbA